MADIKNTMDLSTFIKKTTLILLDGAMGTQLAERGYEMGGRSNLTAPEKVLEVHKEYTECGCDILITNTLTMNRIYMETNKTKEDIREVNLSGVKLAKQATGRDQYVLGDIGSTGKLLKPFGPLAESDAIKTYVEQASILAEGGVDGFIIETMIDIREALAALRACREVSSLPVIVSMSFSSSKKGGSTIMGNSSIECSTAVAEAGADVFGANCGNIDPFQMAEIISVIRRTIELPLWAKPNAGKPRFADNKTTFDMQPEEFVKGVSECIEAGAAMVGGCCGTSPKHIRALADTFIRKNN